MARNPFEQLQDLVVEPRQAFEDIASLILHAVYPDSRRVRVHRGDGGIDTYRGTLGEGGKADVYQIKYFPGPWGDSQKQQIRDAYGRASKSTDYILGDWFLCVPTRLTKEDLRWFDDWRSKQESDIDLIDGDELSLNLAGDQCTQARTKLKEWGVIGLQAGGAQFNATAFLHPEKPESGLTAVAILRVENVGDRTAREIKAVITHGESGCLSHQEHPDWQRTVGDGVINPRTLRYGHTLNPGDQTVIMDIPLCERSTMPFTITVKLTAADMRPTELYCQLSREQIALGQPVAFGGKPPDIPKDRLREDSPKGPTLPSTPVAKEILELILAHPTAEERGLTEILVKSPTGPLEAHFIPNTTARGKTMSVKKTLLRIALAELVQSGWLFLPEGDGKVQIYELNPSKSHS